MLPDAWISKIFSKFEGRHGSLFLDRWRGCDMANVRETWAEELSGFRDQPERIAYALRALADQQFPPTLPEFIAACRRAPAAERPALPHKPTEADLAHQRDMAQRISDSVGVGKMQGGIDVHWATHPRSASHLRAIFDAAAKDARFRPCIASMVRSGFCTEDGRLLKTYHDVAFARTRQDSE